ncbi:hypothetical protein HDV00_011611 [Rhizophlyctis rosea]|nr:hypothetical protein HDV00_011611 [Rhizophlyctis rosea]
MTERYIKHLCKEQKLYSTPELNDKLYLHFKGFAKIENLEKYTGLKSIWLEGNGITNIEGLDTLTELRCLNNLIKKIENLSMLPVLKTVQVAHNFLRSADDIQHLVDCEQISILDLSHNKLEDPDIVEVFAQMPNLAVLNLMSNPVISKIQNYRRTMVSRCKSLTYLDDRPVFDNERRATEAWAAGGVEAERAERTRMREEELAQQNRNFEALKKLQEEARARRREQFGDEEEPTFGPKLTELRDDMLKRVDFGGEDNNEQESDEQEDAAEEDTETKPPVRRFTQLSMAGIVIGGDEAEDQEEDASDEEEPGEIIRIRSNVTEKTSKPLVEEVNPGEDVPALEDATEEVELLRKTQSQNQDTSSTSKRVRFQDRDLLDEIYEAQTADTISNSNAAPPSHQTPTQSFFESLTSSLKPQAWTPPPPRSSLPVSKIEVLDSDEEEEPTAKDDVSKNPHDFNYFPLPKRKNSIAKEQQRSQFVQPIAEPAELEGHKQQTSPMANKPTPPPATSQKASILATRKLLEEITNPADETTEDSRDKQNHHKPSRPLIIDMDSDDESDGEDNRLEEVKNAW